MSCGCCKDGGLAIREDWVRDGGFYFEFLCLIIMYALQRQIWNFNEMIFFIVIFSMTFPFYFLRTIFLSLLSHLGCWREHDFANFVIKDIC